jgi:peptidyl-tRNA hydrolase, PTH1 family
LKKVIVGLGNKGFRYKKTRHNIGFNVIDSLQKKLGLGSFKKGLYNDVARGFFNDIEVVLAKPRTYMNLSGNAVKEIIKKEQVFLDDLIIIYDDVDLDLGMLRFRAKGSSSGHNGLKSIIGVLSTEDFARLRVGIEGRNKGVLIDHVLGRFEKHEKETAKEAVAEAGDAIIDYLETDLNNVMAKYNKKQDKK